MEEDIEQRHKKEQKQLTGELRVIVIVLQNFLFHMTAVFRLIRLRYQ